MLIVSSSWLTLNTHSGRPSFPTVFWHWTTKGHDFSVEVSILWKDISWKWIKQKVESTNGFGGHAQNCFTIIWECFHSDVYIHKTIKLINNACSVRNRILGYFSCRPSYISVKQVETTCIEGMLLTIERDFNVRKYFSIVNILLATPTSFS